MRIVAQLLRRKQIMAQLPAIRRRHQRRSHLLHELQQLTTAQLKRELKQDRKAS